MTWFDTFERWHEFFLMAGTAAVTLAGLLFVALSIHIDALVQEAHEHLLGLARATLFSFTFVLMLSLIMLIPNIGPRATGMFLITAGLAFLVVTLRQIRRGGVDHADFSVRLFRRRLFLPLLGYAWTAFTGVLLMRRDPEALTMVVSAVCMLLANALGTSWDLLVRVARIRRATARVQK